MYTHTYTYIYIHTHMYTRTRTGYMYRYMYIYVYTHMDKFMCNPIELWIPSLIILILASLVRGRFFGPLPATGPRSGVAEIIGGVADLKQFQVFRSSCCTARVTMYIFGALHTGSILHRPLGPPSLTEIHGQLQSHHFFLFRTFPGSPV